LRSGAANAHASRVFLSNMQEELTSTIDMIADRACEYIDEANTAVKKEQHEALRMHQQFTSQLTKMANELFATIVTLNIMTTRLGNASAKLKLPKRFKWGAYAHKSVMTALVIMILVLQAYMFKAVMAKDENVDDEEDVRVLPEIGVVLRKIGPINLALKPIITCRLLNITALFEQNYQFQTEITDIVSDLKQLDMSFYDKYYSRDYQQMQQELERARQITLDAIEETNGEHGATLRDLRKFFEMQGVEQPIEEPLPITHSPKLALTYDRHRRGTNPNDLPDTKQPSGHKQKRAFLPLAAILPLVKYAGAGLGKRLISTAAKAIGSASVAGSIEYLTKNNRDFVKAEPRNIKHRSTLKKPTATTLMKGKSILPEWRFKENAGNSFFKNIDNFGIAAYQQPIANNLRYSMVTQKMDDIRFYALKKRQDLMAFNIRLLQALRDVKEGKIDTFLLPIPDLMQIIDKIERLVKDNSLALNFLGSKDVPESILNFITPLVIFSVEDPFSMILLLIIPMTSSFGDMTLYKFDKIPFVGRDNLTLEVVMPEDYFAVSEHAVHSATLTKESLSECTSYGGRLLCHTPRPISSNRDICAAAIFYGYDPEDQLNKFCNYRITEIVSDTYLHINGNRYMYILRKDAGQMQITCPGPKTSSITLPKAGTLSFAEKCSARIDQSLLIDVLVQHINQTIMPSKQLISLFKAARTPWSKGNPRDPTQEDLLRVARSTDGAVDMPAMWLRAEQLMQEAEMAKIDKQTAKNIDYINYVLQLVIGIAVASFSSIAGFIYYIVTRRCPDRRIMKYPKFLKRKEGRVRYTNRSRSEQSLNEVDQRLNERQAEGYRQVNEYEEGGERSHHPSFKLPRAQVDSPMYEEPACVQARR
jgi:uncharacterized membrane protein